MRGLKSRDLKALEINRFPSYRKRSRDLLAKSAAQLTPICALLWPIAELNIFLMLHPVFSESFSVKETNWLSCYLNQYLISLNIKMFKMMKFQYTQ